MDEGLGPIEIEFLINNPQLVADAKKAQTTLTGMTDSIQKQCVTVDEAINNAVRNGGQTVANSLSQNITRLKINLAQYQQIAALTLDPQKLAAYNAKIEQTTAEIIRLNNVGKSGFNQLGEAIPIEQTGKFENAVLRATSAQNIGARVVTQFTRGLISLGVGFLSMEIGAKAIEGLINWLSKLDYFTGRLDQAKQNMIAFNEVNKEADKEIGKQVTSANLLYKAATDVTLATDLRTAAAERLKATYPGQLAAESALTIMNGKAKLSFDELSESIIKNAQAQSVVAKIGELAAKAQDAQIEKQKIANEQQAELDRSAAQFMKDHPGATFQQAVTPVKFVNNRTPGLFASTVAAGNTGGNADINSINDRAAAANKLQDENLKIIQGQIDFLTKYAGNKGLIEAVLNKPYEIKDPLKNFDAIIKNASDKADLDNLKKALQEKLDALAPNDAQIATYQDKIRQVEEIEKKYQPKTTDGVKEANAAQESLKQRTAILEQIAQVEEIYSQKSENKDDAEIDAIKAKFDKLRSIIAAYNNDPKNKANKIDISILDPAENAAINNERSLQDFDYYKSDLDKQKKIFDDFEAYKLKVGTAKATQLYAADLNGSKSYIDYLQKELSADRIDPNDKSQGTAERKALLTKELQDALTQQKQNYTKLLEGVQTYQTQRDNLTATYLDKRKTLLAAGNTEEASVLDQQYKQQLNALDDANFEQLQSVKELYSGITNLSAASAKKLIADVQAELNARIAAGTISAAEAKKVQDAIDRATNTIDDSLPRSLEKSASILREMAQDVSVFNQGLGDSINLLASIASGTAKAISSYNDLKKAQDNKDTTGEITSGLGLLGSAIGVVSSVVGFFKSSAASARQAKADLLAIEQSLLANQIAYNIAQREQVRTQTDINALTGEQLLNYQKILAAQQQSAQLDFNNLLAQGEATGQQITGHHIQKSGGILGIGKKSKVVDDVAGIQGLTYDQLNELDIEGKLTGPTDAWFKSLQNSKSEIDAINQAAADAKKQTDQLFTGTTANDIASAIIDGFKQGKRTMTDFAGDFGSLMNNALVSAFQSNVLDGQLATFYQQFAAASESAGGLTPDKIAALKASYANIISSTATTLGEIQKITGTPIADGSSGSTSNTLSGQISGITADEANILEGAIHGMQLALVQSNSILADGNATMKDSNLELKKQTLLQMQIVANTGRIADNTDVMKASLENIDSNTSSSNLTNVLRAAGN